MLVIPISDDVIDRAADLCVAARDADLMIAATALVHGRALVTGNTPHFNWITGLSIANWREA